MEGTGRGMAGQRLLIVDDHPLFRNALRQALLGSFPAMEIDEAGSLDQVNAMLVNVPSGANIVGDVYGQRQGYPNWSSADPKVVATAPYFDAMSFAPDIRAASMVAPGFLDVTSPPYGIIAAFNAIQGPKELVPMVESDHNHITPQKQEAWYRRSREALEQLRTTGRFMPNSNWDR